MCKYTDEDEEQGLAIDASCGFVLGDLRQEQPNGVADIAGDRDTQIDYILGNLNQVLPYTSPDWALKPEVNVLDYEQFLQVHKSENEGYRVISYDPSGYKMTYGLTQDYDVPGMFPVDYPFKHSCNGTWSCKNISSYRGVYSPEREREILSIHSRYLYGWSEADVYDDAAQGELWYAQDGRTAGILMPKITYPNNSVPEVYEIDREGFGNEFGPEDLVVDYSTPSPNGPAGYTAFRIVNSGGLAPFVKPGVLGETIHYGKDQMAFMDECAAFFEKSEDIGSIVYTLSYSGGQIIGDVLVNRYGMWCNSSEKYSQFLDDTTWLSVSANISTQDWPTLAVMQDKYFASRTIDSTTVANFSVRGVRLRVQAQAMIAGALIGVGNALSSVGEFGGHVFLQNDKQDFMSKFQAENHKFQSKFAVEQALLGAASKNWLADKEYARSVASKSMSIDTASHARNELNTPGNQVGGVEYAPAEAKVSSSEQAAARSASSPAWEAEKTRPLYKGLQAGPSKGPGNYNNAPPPSTYETAPAIFADPEALAQSV